MATGVRKPDGTREEILALLRRHTSMSVEELARAIGLAPATVRRHLDVLLRDDYVEVSQVRGGTGRPKHVFTLTEAGADMFPHHYVRMTQRLLGEIVSLGQGETAGRSGRQIADVVFERMAERIAAEYGPRVQGNTLEARARSAAELIAEEGIDFEVSVEDAPSAEAGREVWLLGRGCLCTRLDDPAAPVKPCAHDQQMLSELIGAEVVPLPEERVPHDFQCGYIVRPASTA
ncbi:MAG: winged helix-turn-helix transcriptional regulator [Dehalococcoidia bacterium]|nr:winged helix-turn-helix transcriptional regulator [Dehalococcoidia bacterium]